MIDIPMRSSLPFDRNSIKNINISRQTNQSFAQTQRPSTPAHPPSHTAANRASAHLPSNPAPAQAPIPIRQLAVPALRKKIKKGQKVPLDPSGQARRIHICLGWNVTNPQCDLDVSAFILGPNGKVLGDDWFVFYGQVDSPDKSVHFSLSDHTDREYISVDLQRLNPAAAKIIFVLTINEAFTHKLNFSMVKDAYIRILNADTQQELVSFQMTDYYPNVISMMIGEIYLHQGAWKCSAIGNGVAKDLEGLCHLYGVQTV